MTPGARVQAAIDLLDAVILAARDNGPAADVLVQRYFKTRRYAGSKDRRAVRDLLYRAIRQFGEPPDNGRAAFIALADADPALAAAFDGSPHGPVALKSDEPRATGALIADWQQALLPPELRDGSALLARAPLDLRVNTLRGDSETALSLFPDARKTPHAPYGLRLTEGFAIEQHHAWTEGLVEVQDEGSQLLVYACRAKPGITAVDLCAGAGGKTLGLAADMNTMGRLIACDVNRSRLLQLAPRAARAGVTCIETRLLDGGRESEGLSDLAGLADLVLIDAPCSGSGTWRRNPEARWRLTPQRLIRVQALQSTLIDLAIPLLRPGAKLVYAVCSLFAGEGRDQIAQALARYPQLRPIPAGLPAGRPDGAGTLLNPATDGTDGFFVATLEKPC